MGRYCQLVIGPAGAGKSTYCTVLQRHLQTIKRPHLMINLDPAAEQLYYTPDINIRDIISLDECMEETELGPNGGLMFCMEYILENIEWLEEEIGEYDEYIIIDMPGQIELFTHSDIMKRLITRFTGFGLRCCCVYLLESSFMTDYSKFFSGVLTAISAMVQLELPHVNVLSKMDLIEGRPGDFVPPKDNMIPETFTEEEEEMLEKRRQECGLEFYTHPAPRLLLEQALKKKDLSPKWQRLNEAMVHLIEEFDMVSFLPLNIYDQYSLEYILSSIDHGIQFGEDEEPKEPKMMDNDDGEFDGGCENSEQFENEVNIEEYLRE